MGTFYFNAKDESRNVDVLSIHLLLTANTKGGRYTFFNLNRISRKVFLWEIVILLIWIQSHLIQISNAQDPSFS